MSTDLAETCPHGALTVCVSPAASEEFRILPRPVLPPGVGVDGPLPGRCRRARFAEGEPGGDCEYCCDIWDYHDPRSMAWHLLMYAQSADVRPHSVRVVGR
jgi:hypothetical protein